MPSILIHVKSGATRQVRHADALVVIAFQRRSNRVHAHDVIIDVGYAAASTMQVAGIVGDETEDLRLVVA